MPINSQSKRKIGTAQLASGIAISSAGLAIVIAQHYGNAAWTPRNPGRCILGMSLAVAGAKMRGAPGKR
ncbi:MAG: hypothetical protein U0Q16_06880 [Bryobacteraceae bacterium]